MSVVIVGGNECMEREYIDLCRKHGCEAKVFTKMKGRLKSQIGQPDLLVLFTNTMSHKMLKCSLSEIKGLDTAVTRSHRSSLSALKDILTAHL